MDVAFSRDRHAAGGGKAYIQHRLQEQARDVHAWLEEGAHVYLCGDASRLAPDVHQALAGVVASQGGLRSEEHTSELQSLMRISYAVFCLKKKKHQESHDTLVY